MTRVTSICIYNAEKWEKLKLISVKMKKSVSKIVNELVERFVDENYSQIIEQGGEEK